MQNEPNEEFRNTGTSKKSTASLEKNRQYLKKKLAEIEKKALAENKDRLLTEMKLRTETLEHTKYKVQSTKKLADMETKVKLLIRKNEVLSSKLTVVREKVVQLEATIYAAKQRELKELRMKKSTFKGKLQQHHEETKTHEQTDMQVEENSAGSLKNNKTNGNSKSEPEKQSWECPVCLEPRSAVTQFAVTPCGHLFCKDCILLVIKSAGQCPICNKKCLDTEVTPLFL